jgi:TonB family protein
MHYDEYEVRSMRLMSNVLLEYVRCGLFRLRSLALATVVFSAMLPAASALAQAPGIDRWSQLSAANNLDNEGSTPFHLKMTFQLYDLAGKPAETGTVEEWWASPKSRRIIISSPSLNEDGFSPHNSSPSVVRESYLVNQLIDAAVHPVPRVAPMNGDQTDERIREFGKVPLNCLTRKPNSSGAPTMNGSVLCMKPKTDDLRIILSSDGNEAMTRDSTGKFGDTYAALELQIRLVGRVAITGKVTMLQSFDPAKSEVELHSPAEAPAASGPISATPLSGAVLAGKRVKFVQPMYPLAAKEERISGSVLLRVIITKEGTVRDLVPIASSNPIFTEAAEDSVRKWKYSPYLLNGEPTEVGSIITVNFAINGGSIPGSWGPQ